MRCTDRLPKTKNVFLKKTQTENVHGWQWRHLTQHYWYSNVPYYLSFIAISGILERVTVLLRVQIDQKMMLKIKSCDAENQILGFDMLAVDTGWWRPIGSCDFPQKSPTISGSYAKNDLQLKASNGSSPLCTHASCSESRFGFRTHSLFKSQIWHITYSPKGVPLH